MTFILEAALLKMATRAVTFGTVCLIFCPVNAIFLAHSPIKRAVLDYLGRWSWPA